MTQILPRVRVAGGLVYRHTGVGPEVLLIDDRYGRVTLPKGHVEDGELLEEAALREIAEETGIQARIVTPIESVPYSFATDHGETVHKDAFYFLAEMIDGELSAQMEEIRAARFVPVDEALTLVTENGYPNNLPVFERGFAMIATDGADAALFAQRIDHTLLSPGATPEDIARLCREARAYQFASVCVNPLFVSQCAELLGGSPVKVCTVIGFPLGATPTSVKVFEARTTLKDGAEELDLVIAIGKLIADDRAYVEADIRAVVEAAGDEAVVKVILETSLLTPEQIRFGARCAMNAGAHYVKTSTGFAGGGATVESVRLLRETVGDRLGVKASGGIRTPDDARAMVAAGASRIGASSGPKLVVSPLASAWS